MTEQTDWQAKQPSQVTCVPEDLKMFRSSRHYLRAQSQGHHITDHLQERRVERGSAGRPSLKRTREGHRQSDEHWNCFKGNGGKTSEKLCGTDMDFSECIDTILN